MKYLIIFLLLLSSKFGICQLQMKIKHLHVNNVICEPWVKNWDFHENGPQFKFVFEIENRSDTTYVLPVFKDSEQYVMIGNFLYSFSYQGKRYVQYSYVMFEMFSGVIDKDTIEMLPPSISILPQQSIEIWTYPQFLTLTPILKPNKNDYTRDLLELLPTLKVYYDRPDFTLIATEIKEVSIDYYVKDE